MNNQTQFTLVLGGGGMKGVAHVGVLQALTERGLVPSQIVGSSVGALVGAAWSAGKSIAELREIATGLVRKDIFAVAHADMAFTSRSTSCSTASSATSPSRTCATA